MKKTVVCFLLQLCILFSQGQSLGLHFDGVNDVVSIPPNGAVMNGSNFTFETWIKPEKTGSEILSIAKKDHFFLYIEGMGMGPDMDGMPVEYLLMCDLWSTDYNHLYRAHYQIPESFFGTWHHLAATYNGSRWILYVDGAEASNVAAGAGTGNMTAAPLTLGAYENMWYYAGLMDDLRIWNVARSSTSIQANMNKEVATNSAGLVAYYRFNQGVSNGNNTGITAITDASSTANNGTLSNFALTGSSSNFTAGFPQLVVLPLHLTVFTAKEGNKAVILNWQTTPTHASPFTIERSGDGRVFAPIGTVPAITSGYYSFDDRNAGPGTNIYRLASMSANGTSEYSRTVSIKTGVETNLSVYPNPATDVLQLRFSYTGKERILVQDMAGNSFLVLELDPAPALTSVMVSLRISHLPAGIYTLKIGSKSRPFMKL